MATDLRQDGVVNDIAIRLARPNELGAVAELRWRWGQEIHEVLGTSLEEFVPRFLGWARENEVSHRCIVIVRDQRVIGMAWIAIVQRVPHPRVFERASGDMQCVYVVPEERDSGIGSRLIAAVAGLARELGLERVTVHSSERAISAYSRQGFETSPRLRQVVL